MAFKSVREENYNKKKTYERNLNPENRCCANCAYYTYRDSEYVCDKDKTWQNIVYLMPKPEIAKTKICDEYVPSAYNKY